MRWISVLLRPVFSLSEEFYYFFFIQEQKDGALSGYECFSEVFEPILKSQLENEHIITVGEDLAKKEIISQGIFSVQKAPLNMTTLGPDHCGHNI